MCFTVSHFTHRLFGFFTGHGNTHIKCAPTPSITHLKFAMRSNNDDYAAAHNFIDEMIFHNLCRGGQSHPFVALLII